MFRYKLPDFLFVSRETENSQKLWILDKEIRRILMFHVKQI